MGWNNQSVFQLVIVNSGTPSSGLFIYNGVGAPGNGPVLSAVAPGVTTDPFGNPVADILKIYGSGGQAIRFAIVSGVASARFPTGASEEQTSGRLECFITSPGVSEILRFFLNGPQGNVHTDLAEVWLSSAAKDGSTTAGGSLVYTDTGGTSHLYGNWGPTGVRFQSGNPGDGNVYQPERQTVVLNGSLLVTNSFVQLGTTLSMGVGQYVVEGQIMISPTAAGGTANFQFAGGGAFLASSSGITWSDTIQGNPASPGSWSFVDPAVGSGFNTGTLTTGRRTILFGGTINVQTAGTLALFAIGTGGASFNANSRTTFYHAYPVGP